MAHAGGSKSDTQSQNEIVKRKISEMIFNLHLSEAEKVAYKVNITDDDFLCLDSRDRDLTGSSPLFFKRIEVFPHEDKTEVVKRTHYKINGVCNNCGHSQKLEIERGLSFEVATPQVMECYYCGCNYGFQVKNK